MPYQALASLGVIIGMFNVVPALNMGVQYLAYGVSWIDRLFLYSSFCDYRHSVCPRCRRLYLVADISREMGTGTAGTIDSRNEHRKTKKIVCRRKPLLNFPPFLTPNRAITIRATSIILNSHISQIVLFVCLRMPLQKKKELGLTANEWNYRMTKRDIAYAEHAARIRAEMDKKS